MSGRVTPVLHSGRGQPGRRVCARSLAYLVVVEVEDGDNALSLVEVGVVPRVATPAGGAVPVRGPAAGRRCHERRGGGNARVER